ncbi:hypothetical protein Tco_0601407, partial [Tanacetum coccineum]
MTRKNSRRPEKSNHGRLSISYLDHNGKMAIMHLGCCARVGGRMARILYTGITLPVRYYGHGSGGVGDCVWVVGSVRIRNSSVGRICRGEKGGLWVNCTIRYDDLLRVEHQRQNAWRLERCGVRELWTPTGITMSICIECNGTMLMGYRWAHQGEAQERGMNLGGYYPNMVGGNISIKLRGIQDTGLSEEVKKLDISAYMATQLGIGGALGTGEARRNSLTRAQAGRGFPGVGTGVSVAGLGDNGVASVVNGMVSTINKGFMCLDGMSVVGVEMDVSYEGGDVYWGGCVVCTAVSLCVHSQWTGVDAGDDRSPSLGDTMVQWWNWRSMTGEEKLHRGPFEETSVIGRNGFPIHTKGRGGGRSGVRGGRGGWRAVQQREYHEVERGVRGVGTGVRRGKRGSWREKRGVSTGGVVERSGSGGGRGSMRWGISRGGGIRYRKGRKWGGRRRERGTRIREEKEGGDAEDAVGRFGGWYVRVTTSGADGSAEGRASRQEVARSVEQGQHAQCRAVDSSNMKRARIPGWACRGGRSKGACGTEGVGEDARVGSEGWEKAVKCDRGGIRSWGGLLFERRMGEGRGRGGERAEGTRRRATDRRARRRRRERGEKKFVREGDVKGGCCGSGWGCGERWTEVRGACSISYSIEVLDGSSKGLSMRYGSRIGLAEELSQSAFESTIAEVKHASNSVALKLDSEQTDSELSEKEVKKIEADDQAIQIILMGLPEDIYAAVESCKTAQEICVSPRSTITVYLHATTTTNNNFNPQLSFNTNYMQQPMLTPKDITNPTTAMNMTLVLMAKNVGNQNELIVVLGIANQNLNPNGNGNVVAARAEGNAIRNSDLIEEVNANCILMANLQQALTSSTQTDKAPVYDSDGSAENDSNVISAVSNMEQSGGTVEHHHAIAEETRAYFESLYSNLAIEVSEQKDITNGTSVNTKFATQSTWGTKLYSVTPFPNLKIISKVVETNDFSNLVTSNSVPTTTESKVVTNDKVITPRMFRIDPFKTSREDKFVPINKVRASVRTNLITISQPHVITKKDVNSNTNGLSSTSIDITTKTRRPQPRSNTKNDRVPSTSKSSCIKNKEVEVEEHHRNLLLSKNKKHMSSECNNIKLAIRNDKSEVICAMCNANVSNVANQKKHKPKIRKSKMLGSKERLASRTPSEPRICLMWSPTGRIFDLKGKLIASSESECQSDSSNGDNACTSNPLRSNGFQIPLLFLAGYPNLFMELFALEMIAAILGYDDLQWGNILITRVYFFEGLGHNLFSVRQFCDSDLE